MSIFKRLSEIIGEGYSLNLTVQMKGSKMSVTVLPKTIMKNPGPEFKTMQPIVITGTPDELDIGFLAAIVQPLAVVNKLTVSSDTFVKPKKSTTKKAEEKPAESKEPSLDLKSGSTDATPIKTVDAAGTGQAPVAETVAPVTEAAPVAEAEAAPVAAAPVAAAQADAEPTLGEIDEMSGDEGW